MLPLNLIPDAIKWPDRIRRLIACALDRLNHPEHVNYIAKVELRADYHLPVRNRSRIRLPCLCSQSCQAMQEAVQESSFNSFWQVIGDILGPCSLPKLPEKWQEWNAGMIPNLAQEIYDSRSYYRLPELGTVLTKHMKCPPDLIDHLMEQRQHFRGCWALDYLRGAMKTPRQTSLHQMPKADGQTAFELLQQLPMNQYFAKRDRLLNNLLF